MRHTSTLLITCALLLILAPIVAQAGPLAIIGNSLDSTVTVIDTAVSVTNTASRRT